VDPPAFDDTNQADRRSGSSFARLAASGRPPVDRILLALADEFRPADGAGALDQLDELARGLFGIASLSIEKAGTHLIAALRRDGFAPGAPRVEGLMLDRVLRDRRGHPALLAAVYHEVARRAGMRVSLFTAGRDWFVGFEEAGELLLVAPSACASPTGDELDLRRCCAHGLAHGVLDELCRLFRAFGHHTRLAHALRLRELLPVPRGLNQSLSEEQES
jgi:Transglutaminase-like superfamily